MTNRRTLVVIVVLMSLTSIAPLWSQSLMEYVDPQFQNAGLLYSDRSGSLSPFLFDEFSDAVLQIESGALVKNVQLKLDVEHQRILVRYQKTESILNSKLVKSFELLNFKDGIGHVKFMRFDFGKGNVFCEVLYSDEKLTFVKAHSKTLMTRTQIETTGYQDDRSPQVMKKSETYYLVRDGKSINVNLNKKDILNALGEDYQACNETRRYKLNRESGVVELLNDCKN